MQQLFAFLYKLRAFFLFVFLQFVCIGFIIKSNNYQNAAFLNSSNRYAASVLNTSNNVSSYFSLKEINSQLAFENAHLREQLMRIEQTISHKDDSTELAFLPLNQEAEQKFQFIPAQVINNSVRRMTNFITIDKGTADGVEPGMGLINPMGVVGTVRSASKNFATVTSLLHSSVYLSSKIKSSSTFCSTNWDGKDPASAKLLFVPRHVKINAGDTIVTSGYSGLFPEGIMIGTIKEKSITGDATFYDIKIDLSTDFYQLQHVYVVKNLFKVEKDSLEHNSFDKDEW
jgi:rod shape-determining protein MreC